MKSIFKTLLILCLFAFGYSSRAQNEYFFPEGTRLNANIPSPEAFLGYPIGDWHTRHDRIVSYFQELARLSDRATFQIIGYTNEVRPQVVLTVTSPANHARLEEIRQNHLKLSQPGQAPRTFDGMPSIILLGHNVHGNEPSGAEAALLVAYYYVANEDPTVLSYLDNAVLMIDPSFNPDGRDRHSQWVNSHKGFPPVADPIDREHNEAWPGGRTNHYWFDLNRDWYPLAHVESQNRVRFFHQWLPNVLTDYHEMGTNSTYFFEPTKPFGSENPVIPRSNYEVLNVVLAKYYAETLDQIGSLYFTKEQYDNSYVGYGSTYPDLHGGLGLVFEQASSRGHVQNSSTGPLTFAFTIRNQLRTALATVQGTVENRELFHKHMVDFFNSAVEEGKASAIKGYVFGDKDDMGKTSRFVQLLKDHQVEMYKLERNFAGGGHSFQQGEAYYVPTAQRQYRMVRSIFEDVKTFYDSSFYDASSWSMANAYNMPYAEVRGQALAASQRAELPQMPQYTLAQASYAYVFDWKDYNAARTLHHIQEQGLLAQVVTRPIRVKDSEGVEHSLGYGAISIPLQVQNMTKEEVHTRLQRIGNENGVRIHALNTGFSIEGIDLGSGNVITLNQPKALMVIGSGTNGTEAGEVWYLLDKELGMPITKVDAGSLNRINWSNYNTLILVTGSYDFGDSGLNELKAWVRSGGNIIAVKGAVNWLASNGFTTVERVTEPSASLPDRADYVTSREYRGSQSIGGVMLAADMDLSHPLAYGYTRRYLPVYRNHSTLLKPSSNPFNTVVKLTDNPHLSGYLNAVNKERVKNTASLMVAGYGRGNLILFVDNPNFRGTWFGTNKLFFNALFFGSVINGNP